MEREGSVEGGGGRKAPSTEPKGSDGSMVEAPALPDTENLETCPRGSHLET